jgi:hypothetical protein
MQTTPTAADITVATEKTSANREVIRIGQPRLQLVPGPLGRFEVRLGASKAFAVDGNELKIWELEHGTLIERFDLATGAPDPAVDFAVSPDGAWLAGGNFSRLAVRQAPFDQDAFEVMLARPHRFTRDLSQLFASASSLLSIDLARHAVIAKSPASPIKTIGTLDVATSDDAMHVWWIRDKGLLHWDRATDKLDIVGKASSPWLFARSALRAPIAVVADATSSYRLELGTGALTKLVPSTGKLDVSPSGERAVIGAVKQVSVIDTMDGAPRAAIPMPAGVDRVTYTDDDNAIAVIEHGQIRIIDLPGRIRTFDAPSRFRGWLAKGVAAIERGSVLEQLDAATRATSALAAAPSPTPAGRIEVAMTRSTLTIRDRSATANLATLDVGAPPRPGPNLEYEYWRAAASPKGTHIALVWRRADVWAPPPEDGVVTDKPPVCTRGPDLKCTMEYFIELWSITSTPARIWQLRPDAKRPTPRRWPLPKEVTGPIVFTHDGARVLLGFADGDVMIRSIDAAPTHRVEQLHRAPITRIEVSPDDQWVFTEDAEGEQRIWPLTR